MSPKRPPGIEGEGRGGKPEAKLLSGYRLTACRCKFSEKVVKKSA